MDALPEERLRAALWMAVSAVFFSAMAVLVKRLSSAVPESQMIFFRGAVNVAVVLPLAWKERNWNPPRKSILFLRGFAGFLALLCFFHSIERLPLSVAALINWSSPVFVVVLSRFFMKEHFPARGWIGVLSAFLGLGLLLRPSGGWGALGATAIPAVTALIAVLGAFFSSIAYVAIRAASSRVGPHTIVLYFSGVVTLLSLPFSLQGPRWVWEAGILPALLLMGFFASVGQISMTFAYRYAKAGVAATMNLMTAAFSTLWGVILFRENLTNFQWTGMLCLGVGIALASVPVSATINRKISE